MPIVEGSSIILFTTAMTKSPEVRIETGIVQPWCLQKAEEAIKAIALQSSHLFPSTITFTRGREDRIVERALPREAIQKHTQYHWLWEEPSVGSEPISCNIARCLSVLQNGVRFRSLLYRRLSGSSVRVVRLEHRSAACAAFYGYACLTAHHLYCLWEGAELDSLKRDSTRERACSR